MRLSHSHLSVICFVKEQKRIIKHFKSLSIKTFHKTSKNQTNCDILTCSFNHRRSSEEPNYTPTRKNRQLLNNKKFYKNRQQTEIQRLLFQNILKPNSINIKGRLKSLSDDLCHEYPKQFQIYQASIYNLRYPPISPCYFFEQYPC